MRALFEKLELASEIPFLFPLIIKDPIKENWTVFDDCETPWMLERFLKLMIAHDKCGILYSSIIQRNIYKLLKHGVDIKIYFDSPLSLYKISNEIYPEYH